MTTGPQAVVARAVDKHERLARVYDDEVVPVFAGPFAAMALRALAPRPAARLVEVGCTTGHLTLQIARKLDYGSRITALDEAPALVLLARSKLEADPRLGGRITLEVGGPARLPLADGAADLAVSNLAVAESADPPAAMRELARVLAPGGQAVITAPLRGTWAEFLDIYRDVMRENGRGDCLPALDRYVASLPDGDTAAGWLEAAGLDGVEIAVQRWEILFQSAREFFFAPLIELGPLSRWKQVAGRGDEMQDIFFFTKEAIDAYFKGTPFPVTVVGAVLTGRKPPAGAPKAGVT